MLDEKTWLAVFALIQPKGVYRVEVRTLSPVNFLHTKLAHSCVHGPCFVHWCAVMSKKEGAIPKLTQSWEHEIVLVC